MEDIIVFKYEALLKTIYNIDKRSTSLHFNHGAHADIMRQALNNACMYNNPEDATLEDIVNFGISLGEISVYLQEALQFEIEKNLLDEQSKKELEGIYNMLPSNSIQTLSECVEKACDVLNIDYNILFT